MKSIFSILIIIISLNSCQSDSEKAPSVQTKQVITDTIKENLIVKQSKVIDIPLNGLETKFKTYTYNNTNGTTINLETGTQIRIPAGAFEDSLGGAINKNIDIKYREYHNITDIILSGIKMVYNENGKSGDFESAGMFEIRAFQKNKPLFLRKNKTIDVELASFKPGKFNDYNMDEANENWKFLKKSKVIPNYRKQKQINALKEEEKSIPLVCIDEPREYKKGDRIIDIDYDLNRHTELSVFFGAMWIIDGGNQELTRFNNDRQKYNELEIIAKEDDCNKFTLTLWNKVNESKDANKTTYTIIPVWKGKEYRRIKKDYKNKIKAYNKSIKELAKKRRITEREADILRTFKLNNMGIFNCDKTLEFLKMIPVAIILTCKEKIKSWWYITQNKTIAIKYYNPTVMDFKYNPNSTNSIICVTEEDNIAKITNEVFESAFEKSKIDGNQPMSIELKIEEKSVETREEFASHISRF